MAIEVNAGLNVGSEIPLADEAYEWIVNEIMSMRLPANAALSENKLAKSLGFSRTPVREALQRLENEGMLRQGPNSRFTVALLTTKELHEACDLLTLLDVYLFQQAAKHIDSAQADALVRFAETMSEAAAIGDLQTWDRADDQFHEIILEVADNGTAAEIARKTRRRIHRFWTRSFAVNTQRFGECSREHTDLASAIVENRTDDVAPIVAEHIDHMRGSMVEILDTLAAVFGEASLMPLSRGGNNAGLGTLRHHGSQVHI